MDQFGVMGVPHVMLIDKKGQVVFKNNPHIRPNLEADIDNLVNDKSLN